MKRAERFKPLLRAGLLFGGLAALALVSHLSLDAAPMIKTGPKLDDKLAHFLAYAALAFLFAGAQKRPVAYLATGAVLAAYGVGMEAAQGLMGEGREASMLDALANGAGVAAGLAAGFVARAVVFPEPSSSRRP